MVCASIARRSFSTALLLAVLLAPAASQTQRDFPKPTGWVSDYAKVFSAQEKKRLRSLCTEVDQKAHAQIVVVTMQSVGHDSLEDYVQALFNHWGIGNKGENRGMLIFLAVADHKWRIEVGRGLETLFPDKRVA